ncbi:hypothetical protein FQR65_LT18764 [Abscondita terminalis]|nr:hypothetical protein FQR65_LT18764 [Abscondita terminalis]
MKEKVLITGASGFVGFHLVEAAKSAGLEVHAAVRKSSAVSQIEHVVDKFVYPDYEDTDELVALLEEHQYHYVIHAAAMTRAKQEEDLSSWISWPRYSEWHINVLQKYQSYTPSDWNDFTACKLGCVNYKGSTREAGFDPQFRIEKRDWKRHYFGIRA